MEEPDALKNAYHAVAGEIPGIIVRFFSFLLVTHVLIFVCKGSPIFVMKLAGQAWHSEVQLLQISMVSCHW